MALTTLQIQKAKADGKPLKLSDGHGLQLHVRPTGAKLWRMAYRFGERQRVLDLGAFPAVSLADARIAAAQARDDLAKGVDPGAARRQVEQAVPGVDPASRTFADWARDLVNAKRDVEQSKNSLRKHDYVMRQVNCAVVERRPFGSRPIAEIRPVDALAAVKFIKATKTETAIRARGFIGEVFRYAALAEKSLHDLQDPTPFLRGVSAGLTRPPVRHHPATLDAKGFGRILRLIASYPKPIVRGALQISALCFPRPGELRHVEWSHVDLTLGVWFIPAGNTKRKREHAIPLSRQATAIFATLHEITGAGRYCFPSPRSGRPLSDMALGAALRAVGIEREEQSVHGFRASASSLLNESGLWNPDAIEAALSHVEEDGSRRAYNRTKYWAERVRMAQWWADQCDAMAAGQSS